MADEETPASEAQETEAAAPAAEETTVQGDGTAEVEQTAEEEATEVAAPVTEDAPPAEAPPDSQEATDASPEGEEATQGEETSAPVEGDEATPQTEAGKPEEEEKEGEVTTEEAEGEMTEGAEPEGGQEEGAEAEQEPSEDTTGPAEATEGETVAAEETDGQEKVEEEGEAAAEVADKAGEQQEAGAEGADEAQAPPAEGEQDTQPASPLPQSDTFAEGERPETPVVAVMEPLSREGSPQPEPEPLEAGTPERIESPQEEEEFDDEEPWISREELIEAYQAAQSEREQLQNQNIQLQHKLAEYFRKKKTDDQRQEMDKNVTDQEQRYLKYMSNLEELRRQEEEERDDLSEQLEELKGRRQEKLDTVEQETDLFSQLKRQSAENAINSRTGKAITPKDIEAYLLNEAKKEEEVKQVRLENIKLRNRLRKREQQLKAKEELAEGLHLIDFEQLKIENQTYNEKIEERNEELLKLRKKITSTVQELTHVKEKLQFVQAENQVQKGKLKEVESLVAQKRDILSRTKKARDSLRIDNQRLRQKSGLLGNTPLLRDFEERKDEGDELRAKLERLKRQHAELTLSCSGVRRKIEEARSGRS